MDRRTRRLRELSFRRMVTHLVIGATVILALVLAEPAAELGRRLGAWLRAAW